MGYFEVLFYKLVSLELRYRSRKRLETGLAKALGLHGMLQKMTSESFAAQGFCCDSQVE